MGFLSRLLSGAPVVARLSFDLYGPRAWHPGTAVLGPLPASLFPSDHIYGIADYYIEGVLAPLAVNMSLEILDVGSGCDRGQVLIQGWLDLLESQVGKLPKELQYFTLARIDEQRQKYYQDGTAAEVVRPASGDVHLGVVVADLHAGRWLYSTATVRPLRMKDIEVACLVLVCSLAVVANELDENARRWLMFLLSYEMWKWQSKMPGPIGTKSTWDFGNVQGMVDEAKRGGLIPSS